MTPPTSARSALVKQLPLKSNRRSSRVSFVETLGINMDSDDDEDGFDDVLRDCMAASQESQNCEAIKSTVHLGESDSEVDDESDEDGDIYDEYDFDHTKISEMVKAGAQREQVTSAFEEAMAAALARKLKAKSAAPTKDIVSADNPYALGLIRPGETIRDISECMTPGRMTPTEETANVSSESVAERMKQAMESAKLRRRRSSAARKGVAVISEAKNAAAMRRRASLAARMGAGEQENVQCAITQAMQGARRRHRQSISKAAEVLEDGGYGENTQFDEVSAKMSLIEIAMAEARRRHRRSIAKAVEQLQEPPVAALNPSAEVYVPQEHQTWDSAASPFQSQIDQAITSAYQTHCQMEQQSYEYYGDNVENSIAVWQDSGHGYNCLGSCQEPQYNTQSMVNGNCISQNDQSGYYSTQEGYGVSNQSVQNEWSQSNNCYPSTTTNLYSNSNSSQQQSGYYSAQEDYGVSNQMFKTNGANPTTAFPTQQLIHTAIVIAANKVSVTAHMRLAMTHNTTCKV
jgi:hypothetical protein